MSFIRNLFAKKLALASTPELLDNTPAKNQRFLIVGNDLELVGLLDPRTNENTTFYSSENKEIKPGDVVAITGSGDVVDADLYRITAVVGAYFGAHRERDNFLLKVLYMVEEELLEDTDDYDAIHEKYLDYIGIPF